jgi:hypothetical protein
VSAAPQSPPQAESDGDEPGEHAPHEHLPLGGYSVLTSIFATAFTGSLVVAYRRKGELPEPPGVWDVVTAGAATHKLSRTLAKDRVTSFLRAPFVRYEGPAGHGEVEGSPRGEGLRRATGELLVCPYCLGQWIAGAIAVGYVGAPRLTRLITFLYTAETLGDFLHLAYKAAEDASDST